MNLFFAAAALLAAQERVFVEVEADPRQWLVHEAREVVLRVGVAPELLATQLLQPFRRELDLPVQLTLPWWEGGEALRVLESPATPDVAPAARRTLALNDAVAEAAAVGRVTRGALVYETFELRRAFAAAAVGDFELAAPTLRYVTAGGFDEDLFGARIPRERQEASVSGAPWSLRALDWPEQGRPPDFDGAVGRFALEAASAAREAEVGAWIQVAIRVRPLGLAAGFPRPRLHEVPGWRLAGLTEGYEGGGLVLRGDFECLDGSAAGFPALTIEFLDPGPPARYATAQSAALPLEIRPMVRATDPVSRQTAEGASEGWSVPWVWWLLPAVFLLGMGAARWFLLRAKAPKGAPTLPLLAADAPPEAMLARVLAHRLQCTEAAVIGPDLEGRLRAAGVDPDLAGRAARLMEEMVAARYGGPRREGAGEEARSLTRILAQTAAGDSAASRGRSRT